MLSKIWKFILREKYFILGLILTLGLTWPLFHSGFFTHHDNVQIIRLYEMDKCIRDFQIPCRWVPNLGGLYGYPLFNYYGPLPYYFGEIFYLIINNLIWVAKIMFGFSFLASFVFMYLLGSRLWKNKLAGTLSGLFFAYAPYHAVDFYVRGAMGEMWALAFIPAVFWATLSFFETKKRRYFLLNAFFIALLSLSHNLSLMMFLPFICGFGLLLAILHKNWNVFGHFLLSLLLGFGLSAFYIVPAYFEKNLVHVDTTTMGYFSYTEHFKGLYKLFIQRMWGWGASVREVPGGERDGMSFQIGWVHLAAYLISGIGLFLNFKKTLFKKYFWVVAYFSLMFALAVFMIHPRSVFVWNLITPLKYLQFPWRFLMMIIFVVSLISGSVVIWFRKKWLSQFLALILLVAAVVLNFSYFRPEKFIAVKSSDYLSGTLWDSQIKRSIFDYLPIYAKAPPAELADFQYQIYSMAQVDIANFKKGSNWLSFQTKSAGESTITLAQYYFPNWKIKIDGKVTQIDHGNDLGLMTIIVPAGEHQISAKLYDTPIRIMANILTLFSIGGYLFLTRKK